MNPFSVWLIMLGALQSILMPPTESTTKPCIGCLFDPGCYLDCDRLDTWKERTDG